MPHPLTRHYAFAYSLQPSNRREGQDRERSWLMRDLLVVDCDRGFRESCARQLPRTWRCRHAGTMAEALRQYHSAPVVDAAVVDLSLPDGTGWSLVERLRTVDAALPCLIVSADRQPTLANQAHMLGVGFAYKVDVDAIVRAFLSRLPRERGQDFEEFRTYARDKGLSPREVEVLLLAVGEVPRCELAARIGVSENTLKVYVRSLLRKCRACTLADVARGLRQRTAPRPPEQAPPRPTGVIGLPSDACSSRLAPHIGLPVLLANGETIMADNTKLSTDLLNVLAANGVVALPQATTAGAADRPQPGSQAIGAYITSIITGDQAFSEETLARVTGVLNRGAITAPKPGA
jgi:DNA-binding NarL/FixJ family response regulator